MHRIALAALAFVVVGCGDDEPGGPSGPPPLEGDLYAVNYGPIKVEPGQEDTQCMNLRLSNTSPIKVHQLRNRLSGGSHHLIVYKIDDPAIEETAAPYPCTPFAGALNPTGRAAPVMITQKVDDALTLPDRVAYTFAPNQMIRIEMHYINRSDVPIDVTATSEFYAVPDSAIDHEANILFIGTIDIELQPGVVTNIETYFTPRAANLDLSGAKFFAVTGHTHQHGRNVTVSLSTARGTAQQSIYAPAPFEWSEPETTTHQPEFSVPDGLQAGFNLKCQYHNTSNEVVKFGESANDEMCFFWAYYYPSKGAHVCVRSDRIGIDACCPDLGEAFCSMFEF